MMSQIVANFPECFDAHIISFHFNLMVATHCVTFENEIASCWFGFGHFNVFVFVFVFGECVSGL